MQGKAVIGYGQGGQGSRTPGRGGLGTGLGAGGGGIGGVGGNGVGYSGVLVAAPQVIHATNTGGTGRNTRDLGNYVRGRESQLQVLLRGVRAEGEPGARRNGDRGRDAHGRRERDRRRDLGSHLERARDPPRRRQCIKQRIAGWRFPKSDQGGGTYSFSFSFSK